MATLRLVTAPLIPTASALASGNKFLVGQGTDEIAQETLGNLAAFIRTNLGLWYTVGASAVAVTNPADTTEDILATVTIPAGALGPNGELRIWSQWSTVSSGNNKTARVRLGGIGGTMYLNQALTTHTSMHDLRRIANRNAQNSQIGGHTDAPAINRSTNAVITSAIDTSASTTIVFTGQLANSADTLKLESYRVEILYGA